MDLQDMYEHLTDRTPLEDVAIRWDAMPYTSEKFNRVVKAPSFRGWSDDLRTDDEVGVIVGLSKAKRGDSVLDVACGYGRHDLVLAGEYGLNVTGVDISTGLIENAMRRADEQRQRITFKVMNAVDLSWESTFDFAMIAYNSFSLFSDEDAPLVVQGIHRALRTRGRFFMDLDNKPFYVRYGRSHKSWYLWKPGGLTLQETYLHEDISVEVTRYSIFRPNAETADNFIEFKRVYSEGEIRALLAENGFRVGDIFGDWDLSALQESSPKMILVGEKQ